MATTIDGISVVSGRLLQRHSALRLAVAAGRIALNRTHTRPSDVDLLINAGIYRDRNLGEPALAPLIQQDMGVNPGDPRPGTPGTFSFDVANGACGLLNALQVADGFLQAQTIRTAVVVASDADPGHGHAPHFPFPPAGGALVCRWQEGDRGLAGFRWHNTPDGGESFRSTVAFRDGHNLLTVTEDPVFPKRAAEAAAEAAEELLADLGLDAGRIDTVVAGPSSAAFLDVLVDRLGLLEGQVVTDPGGDHFPGGPTATSRPGGHTVGILAALKRAEQEGRLQPGSTVLIACGGAGVTGGAALYRG